MLPPEIGITSRMPVPSALASTGVSRSTLALLPAVAPSISVTAAAAMICLNNG